MTAVEQARKFPPRERGWSLKILLLLLTCRVSPARAGMVRRIGLDATKQHGFPRASGDGPCPASSGVTVAWFPPRERGWSPAVFLG